MQSIAQFLLCIPSTFTLALVVLFACVALRNNFILLFVILLTLFLMIQLFYELYDRMNGYDELVLDDEEDLNEDLNDEIYDEVDEDDLDFIDDDEDEEEEDDDDDEVDIDEGCETTK